MDDIEKRITEIMKPAGPSGWSLFGQVVIGLPLSLLGTMAVVKCLEPMWTWFVTPITGVAVPAFWLLVGFMMTMGFFTHHIKKSDFDEPDPDPLLTIIKISSTRAFAALIVLGMGWFVHQMV